MCKNLFMLSTANIINLLFKNLCEYIRQKLLNTYWSYHVRIEMFYSSLYKRYIDWSVRWSGIYFLILLEVFVFNLVTENICSAREVYESSLLLTIDF